MGSLTIEELAQRLDVHVDVARRAVESLLAKGLIEKAPVPAVTIDYCHCGAIADEGHTLTCVMERMKRARAQPSDALDSKEARQSGV